MARKLEIVTALLLMLVVSACTLLPNTSMPSPMPSSTREAAENDRAVGGELRGDLTVFAAASLTDAFGEIGKNFQAAHPGTNIVYNFAGSQQLVQQLGQGAPADVFASANGAQMQVAVNAGRVVSGTQRNFAHNRLVVIYPLDNPAAITTLEDLAKPGIKLVLAAAEVPVGSYSLQFLGKASATVDFGRAYSETVLANVVSYEENVRSVLSKVALGEADAGIVYTSDVVGDGAAQVGKIQIPDELNTVANYPVAVISDSANPELARAFMDYLLAADGQEVLAAYGFLPVNAP
jgi:molybdate transport system substrate-binding protein